MQKCIRFFSKTRGVLSLLREPLPPQRWAPNLTKVSPVSTLKMKSKPVLLTLAWVFPKNRGEHPKRDQ